MLPGVDEHVLEVTVPAQLAYNGALFMKFGLVPTTDMILGLIVTDEG